MKWILFHPELYLVAVSGIFLLLSLTQRDDRRDYLLAVLLTAVGMGVSIAGISLRGDLFFDTYRVDLFSQTFKVLLSMGLFLTVSICGDLDGVEARYRTEFYFLLSVCTLSMMTLVSSLHVLTLYISLELSSYSLYVLVYLRRFREYGVKTAVNYFLIGATASAVMLFGIALLYGSLNAVYLTDLMKALPEAVGRPMVFVGFLFLLCGFFFKLAVFPFHFWAPDVYEGAPNQVSAYIATASKVAAIAVLMRIVALAGEGSPYLVHALAALAIVSMTVGNLSAIAQKDLKRLLAYSSVAHAGYVLVGILSMNAAGYTSAIFYSMALLAMKFTCFLVVVTVAWDGANIDVNRLAGLHQRAPVLALALMVALFGLAGIPPTVGFTGKLLIFTAAMQKGYFVLVLIAMFNVVISLYYYLLVLKAAYLLEPVGEPIPYPVDPWVRTLAGLLIFFMIAAGIYPRFLIVFAQSAAAAIF